MRAYYPKKSLARICLWFGVTRQAFYKHQHHEDEQINAASVVLKLVQDIRKEHPRMGTRKLLILLQEDLKTHQIKMGRDALFDLLASHKLLIRRRKRRVNTTQSHHWLRKYSNLIRNLAVERINQVWVSDITYLRLTDGSFAYISFITDAYSKKIVGHQLAFTLEAINSIQALQKALQSLDLPGDELIHHSDRGIQYCSHDYVKLLEERGILISMSENSDPLENAIAERVNGIIKQEYLEGIFPLTKSNVSQLLDQAITKYNEKRPHMSCDYLTPDQAHSGKIQLKKKWKNYSAQKANIVNP